MTIRQRQSVRLLPYPAGKTFAFTIIDDTDGATLEIVRTVYDFLYSQGLRTTKTVWAKNPSTAPTKLSDQGDTLENAAYAEYVRVLRDRGFEIALHNVSSNSNPRSEIISGLDAFRQIIGDAPKINVHHEKNRENLYFEFAQSGRHLPAPFRTALFTGLHKMLGRSAEQASASVQGCAGEDPHSEYFWGDLCRSTFKYVRTNVFFPDLNTLQCSPAMPYHRAEAPYVNYWFDSSNGQDAHHFNSILSDRNVQKLRQEQGCCILYTHFGKGFVSESSGAFELNAETKRRVQAVAGHCDGWYAPVSEILDRLLACQQVSIVRVNNSVLITNHNDFAIESFTMQAEPGAMCLNADGKILPVGEKGQLVLASFPAGASVAILGPHALPATQWNADNRNRLFVDVAKIVRKIGERLTRSWERQGLRHS